jgi:glutamate 5-kinase
MMTSPDVNGWPPLRSTQTKSDDVRQRLAKASRLVVKLGTSTVTDADGSASQERLAPIVESIARLHEAGKQIVLVSSGAVGLGRGRLGLHRARTSDVVLRQACAAVGQSLLMHCYERLFREHGINIAQLLLTQEDFVERNRYSNLRQTTERLLKLGVVPVINENDTVSTAELQVTSGRIFSDNDRLAALVASKLDAEALILLTNVDGLLDGDGQLIPVVTSVDAQVKAMASGPSVGGRGGMVTKLEAAEIAMRAGTIAVIANGRTERILERISAGETLGTVFVPPGLRMAGKRRWIAYAADVRGAVVINAGACSAISTRKASLLWSGVVKVERPFDRTDVISILDPEGAEFARGIADFSSDTAEVKAGSNGSKGSGSKALVLVKRDNIVLVEPK